MTNKKEMQHAHTDEMYERHRDRCDELRELVEDLSMVWGPDCKELLKALDAYEREPQLIAELEQLRNTVKEFDSGTQ